MNAEQQVRQVKPFFQGAPMSTMQFKQPDEFIGLLNAKYGSFPKVTKLGPAAEERFNQLMNEKMMMMVMSLSGGELQSRGGIKVGKLNPKTYSPPGQTPNEVYSDIPHITSSTGGVKAEDLIRSGKLK